MVGVPPSPISSKKLTVSFPVLFGDFAESKSKDFKGAIDEEDFAEEYGYLSDSDLEDDEDEKLSLKRASKSETRSFDPFSISGEDKIACEDHEEHIEKGKVVKIPDVAFVTWVESSNPINIPLTSPQVPGFSRVSLHGCNRVRTVWIRRESQIAKRRNR
jgi:hypothetical protein